MVWINTIAILVLAYLIISPFIKPRFLTGLSEEEFRAGYRKAQLIDVREQNEYDGGHILGARNIPTSQLSQRMNEVRNDQPVYLYSQTASRSYRAAKFLKKKRGITDIYYLQGGFRKWTGKIKKK
ncbi:rhodanese-like domain-containing protein [Anaerobacillus sp. MEB173]|uniref:rhodanese-like domain-containing protein n=1 Tax=Anaerobacillus sp. MEB173 TaxID=3383345 RepID=UPI003F8DB86E